MQSQSNPRRAGGRGLFAALLGAAVAFPAGYAFFESQSNSLSLVYAQQAETAERVSRQTDPKAIEQADTLSTAFRNVAKIAKPSVVSVKAFATASNNPGLGSRGFGGQFGGPGGGGLPPGLPEEFYDFFGVPRERGQQSPRGQQPQEEPTEQQYGSGSGVIVSEDGYIITNNHVVTDADRLTVLLSDDRELDAEVVGTDPYSDLAVLKVDADGLAAVKIGNSDNVQVGDWVVAIGSPFGLTQTVTAGIVSATNRIQGITAYDDLIQTDAAINPGNSGGPLLNLRGELIGINTAIASRDGGYNGIGFAIPTSMVDRVFKDIVKEGRVVRGFISTSIEDTPENREALNVPEDLQGVLVTGVGRGGPADNAGVQVGDVIQAVNGDQVADPNELRRAVAALRPGTKASFTVSRDGEKVDLNVVIGEQTADALASLQGELNGEGLLGLKVSPVTEEDAEELGLRETTGVLVEEVAADSPFRGTVRPGDAILSVNGDAVTSLEDLTEAITTSRGTIRMIVANSDGERLVTIQR